MPGPPESNCFTIKLARFNPNLANLIHWKRRAVLSAIDGPQARPSARRRPLLRHVVAGLNRLFLAVDLDRLRDSLVDQFRCFGQPREPIRRIAVQMIEPGDQAAAIP
jgi:hypothetical protein